jgi:hypothetical protein
MGLLTTYLSETILDLTFCHAGLYGEMNQANLESPSGTDHKMLFLSRMKVEGGKKRE